MPLSPPLHIRKADWGSEKDILMHLREQVFVQEQGVPADLELDEHDPLCLHLIALDAARPVGTGRLLQDGHIGRLAVLPPYRSRGIGRALLESLILEATARGIEEAILNAQVKVIPFYERAGFIVNGPEFLDAGIPHRVMRRSLVCTD